MEEGFFVELLFDLHAAMPCCFKGQFKQQVPIDCLKSCSEVSMWMKKATKIALIGRVVRQNMLMGNVSFRQATRRKQLFATSSSAALGDPGGV